MRAGKASRKHRRGRTSLPTGVLAWTGVAALVCVGAATFAAALPGEPVRTLRGLSVSHDQGRVLVRIDVDTPVRYEAAMLSDPIRYVLHLHGVGASGRQPSDFSVDYGPVRDVAVVRDSADAHHVRVVVALREPTPCNAGRAADGRGMVIVVGDGGLDALAAAPDRPSVGGPRLALPTAGLTGSLWHGFLRAVRAEPAALPVVETPSVEPAAHLTVSTTTAVAIELEPVTTSANSVILPALAEQTAALKLPAIGARTADVKASRPTMQLVAAMMPGHGSVVTPASYAPLMSATPRLPRRAILTDIRGRTMLASLPTTRLPNIVRPAAVPVPAVAPPPRAAITSVWQRPAPNGFELHIETSANVGFHTERLSNPQRYVLHLPGTELTPDCARELQVDDGVVGRVRLVPNEQETAVSLELTGPAACTAYRVPGETTLIAAVTPSEVARMAQVPAGPRRPAAAEGDLIDLMFYQADMAAILEALAKSVDKNLIASGSVQGTMTIDLSGVTIERALDVVTKLQGYDYVLLGDRTYVVGTEEELAKIVPPEEAIAERGRVITYEPKYAKPSAIAEFFNQLADDLGIEVSPAIELNMVIFKGIKDDAIEDQIREQLAAVDKQQAPITTLHSLEHLRPAAAKSALESFVPEVTVTTARPDVPVQVIQIRGSPDAIAQAEAVLKEIDVEPVVEPLPPEALVTEIVSIDYGDPGQIQATVQTMFPDVELIVHGETAEEAELQMEGIREAGIMYATGTLVVRGERGRVDDTIEAIKALDVAPARVQISASIIEISYTRNATVGLVWSLPGIVFREASAVDGWRFGKFIRDPLTFSSILTAVDTKAQTRILSNPKIVVESTKRGKILVGEIIPFETTVPGEGTVTRSLNFQEVGLGIDFTPVVKSDGNIQMYLRPHVSNFGEFTPSGFPRISTRETETILSARDGDTIIIGGLLQEQDIITKSGIPLLQGFPFVGELFRQRNKSRQKTEVVVMATVELLAPGAPASGE